METVEKDIAPETVEAIRRYAGRQVFERKNLTIEVFSEYGATEWTLPDFLSDVNEAVAKIPEALRASATVDLEGGYDESTSLKISFDRQETDKEYEDRIRELVLRVEHDRKQRAIAERGEYERLKAKFG